MPAGDALLSFEITARADEDARIARVFHEGDWQGDAGEAGMLLETVCRRWPKDVKVDILVLCGGFLQFRWPDRLMRRDIGDNLNPSKETVDLLYKEAEKCFRQMAREHGPELLIWHPHKSDTPRTWIPGLGGLRKELPGTSYISAGMYHNDGAVPRASLGSVLKHTKNMPALDLIVKIKNEGY